MTAHSIRHPLTAGLFCAALLLAPTVFAAPASKTETSEQSFKDRKDEKKSKDDQKDAGKKSKDDQKKVAKKAKDKKGQPHLPPAKPTAVPELNGGQWASAAALLGGAFLLLTSRRRRAPAA